MPTTPELVPEHALPPDYSSLDGSDRPVTLREEEIVAPHAERGEDQLVLPCVLDITRPFENLPEIKVKALSCIGCCVALYSTGLLEDGKLVEFVFKGYVFSLTSDGLCLFQCRRYLKEVFVEEERKKKASRKNCFSLLKIPSFRGRGRNNSTSFRPDEQELHVSFPETTGRTTGSRAGSPEVRERDSLVVDGSHALQTHPELQIEYENFHSLRANSSNETFSFKRLRVPVGENSRMPSRSPLAYCPRGQKEEVQEHLKKLVCLGPFPFATFSRKEIHKIFFTEPENDGNYPSPLFSCSENRMRDMNYLRMFVRRYLVYSSLGRNPSQISLKAYASRLLSCPSIDEVLLQKVAKEELEYLLTVDKELLRHPGGVGPSGIEVMIPQPQRPWWIHRQIPLQSPEFRLRLRIFFLELAIMVLSLITIACGGVTYFLASEIFSVVTNLYAYCYLVPAICLASSAFGTYHLASVSPPLQIHYWYSFVHVLLSAGGAALASLAGYKLLEVYFDLQNESLLIPCCQDEGPTFLPITAIFFILAFVAVLDAAAILSVVIFLRESV